MALIRRSTKVENMTIDSIPTFTAFISSLARRQSPALLWYSAPGERIELSGRVLDNWVSKSANFLVDECELGAAQQYTLTQQVHWRSLVLLLAALRVGARLTFEGGGEGSQVHAAFSPAEIEQSAAEYPVLVDRGPLSMRFMGQVPAGTTDYCAEVRSHSDAYSGFSLPHESDAAFKGLTYRELMQRVAARAAQLSQLTATGKHSLLLETSKLSLNATVDVLGALMAGYSVLVLDPQEEWADERKNRIMSDERATAPQDLG